MKLVRNIETQDGYLEAGDLTRFSCPVPNVVGSNPAWCGLPFFFVGPHGTELDLPTLNRIGLVIPKKKVFQEVA